MTVDTLADVIAQAFMFVGLSDEEAVDPHAAVKLLENMTASLKRMSQEDRSEFCAALKAVAARYRAAGASDEEVELIQSLVEELS